jgi:hypothetical protein
MRKTQKVRSNKCCKCREKRKKSELAALALGSPLSSPLINILIFLVRPKLRCERRVKVDVDEPREDGEYGDDTHLTIDDDRPRIEVLRLEGVVVFDVNQYLRYRLEELRFPIVRGRHRLHAGLDIIGGGELGEDSPRYREEVTSTTLLPMELAIGIFTGNTMVA